MKEKLLMSNKRSPKCQKALDSCEAIIESFPHPPRKYLGRSLTFRQCQPPCHRRTRKHEPGSERIAIDKSAQSPEKPRLVLCVNKYRSGLYLFLA